MAGPKVREALRAADDARLALRIGLQGPLPDALLVVEELGEVPVAILDLPAGLAGAYGRRRDQPFIFLNSNEPIVRQRFTLAHEYGHHSLKHRPVIDSTDTVFGGSKDLDEIQANYFAGAFLLPRDALESWAERLGIERFDLEALVRLASTFSVSAKMARVRLEICKKLTPTEKANLDQAIAESEHRRLAARLGINADGPSDELAAIKGSGRIPRFPTVMHEYGIRGLELGLVDPDRLADALGRDRPWVDAQMEGLDVGADDEDDWDF